MLKIFVLFIIDKCLFSFVLTIFYSIRRDHSTKKTILRLKQVQRRVTKLVDQLHQKSYGERLVILGLTTVRTRMLRADLIEVYMYKICKGMDNLEPILFFNIRSTGRGHELKLYKEHFRLEIVRNKYAN